MGIDNGNRLSPFSLVYSTRLLLSNLENSLYFYYRRGVRDGYVGAREESR